MEPVFLSRQQVRQMLGNISYESLNRYVADGVIPRPVRFGSRDKWDRDALIDFLKRRVSEAA
jgi:predicted DNA-binding transcriptional regulator AlpA